MWDDVSEAGKTLSLTLTVVVGGRVLVVDPIAADVNHEGDVPADQQGSYVLHVCQTAPAPRSYGFAVPYSPGFSGRQPTNFGLLRDLASSAGGVVQTNPTESFAHNLRLANSAGPIWPYLIAALVPLFLLDVALRRLRHRIADLQPVLDRLRGRGLSPATAKPTWPHTERPGMPPAS
jgi:hypothetical protein